MDSVIVFRELNPYLSKKSATVLRAVCHLAYDIIVPKSYRSKMLQLDTSESAIIEMYTLYKKPYVFVHGEDSFFDFLYIKKNLRTFKNTRVWKKHHWCTFLSYIAYSYAVSRLDEYSIDDYNDFLEQYISLYDESIIIELCLFTSYKHEMDIEFTFMDFYNIIDKYPIENLNTYHYIQEFILA